MRPGPGSRHVLIVSAHFPPSNVIGAHRVGSFARYLVLEGWEVTVITVASGRPERWEGATVRGVMDPLAGLRRRLARPNARRVLRFVSRVASGLLFRMSVPDAEAWWALVAEREIEPRERPDVVFASGPSFSAFRAARRIARKLGVPLVCDYRDLWTASPYYRHGRVRRGMERRMERQVLRASAMVTTVSGPLAEDLDRIGAARTAVVMNGFEPADYPEHKPMNMPGPLRLVYCGQLYTGKRDPEPLLQALAHQRLTRDEIVVLFRGPSLDLVVGLARRWGVEDLVDVGPPVSHQESIRLQCEADALLLLLWNDPREAGVYTGKIFEYLGARRPILMLGLESGVAAELLRDRGAGVVANDPAVIGDQIRAWVDLKQRGELSRLPASVSEGLSRQDQARRLSEILGSCLP